MFRQSLARRVKHGPHAPEREIWMSIPLMFRRTTSPGQAWSLLMCKLLMFRHTLPSRHAWSQKLSKPSMFSLSVPRQRTSWRKLLHPLALMHGVPVSSSKVGSVRRIGALDLVVVIEASCHNPSGEFVHMVDKHASITTVAPLLPDVLAHPSWLEPSRRLPLMRPWTP